MFKCWKDSFKVVWLLGLFIGIARGPWPPNLYNFSLFCALGGGFPNKILLLAKVKIFTPKKCLGWLPHRVLLVTQLYFEVLWETDWFRGRCVWSFSYHKPFFSSPHKTSLKRTANVLVEVWSRCTALESSFCSKQIFKVDRFTTHELLFCVSRSDDFHHQSTAHWQTKQP